MWLDLAYIEPSIGAADSFTLGWQDGSVPMKTTTRYPLKTSSWKRTTYRLTTPVTRPLQDVNLSRNPGTVTVRFYDATEGAGMTPNGTGPIVDDVRITGYKFGPISSLAAQYVSGSGVKLTWGRPGRSTAQPKVPEERALAYRVWRRSIGGSWTELTSHGRISATQFTDPRATKSSAYQYAVQAWDVGTGAGYGAYSAKFSGLYVGAPKPASKMSRKKIYTVSGTIMPRHSFDILAGAGVPLERQEVRCT